MNHYDLVTSDDQKIEELKELLEYPPVDDSDYLLTNVYNILGLSLPGFLSEEES